MTETSYKSKSPGEAMKTFDEPVRDASLPPAAELLKMLSQDGPFDPNRFRERPRAMTPPPLVTGEEQVVEKIVEKIVEVPVEKIVEKIVEVPVEKVVEKVVEVSHEAEESELPAWTPPPNAAFLTTLDELLIWMHNHSSIKGTLALGDKGEVLSEKGRFDFDADILASLPTLLKRAAMRAYTMLGVEPQKVWTLRLKLDSRESLYLTCVQAASGTRWLLSASPVSLRSEKVLNKAGHYLLRILDS